MINDTSLSVASIQAARERLGAIIHRTPLLSSTALSEMAGGELRFKGEHLQRTGSFKIRGALNRLSQIQGASGVVTASSGNHGQAVAWAARHFGMPAHVVVPTMAPAIKVHAAEAFGATIERCGTRSRERLERAQSYAREHDYVFVPPYDDIAVMSGQGTIGLEMLEDWPEVDVVLVPIGGGGLISGIATAIKETSPRVRVIGVEPQGAAKAWASRRAGHHVALDETDSIADGLISLSLGDLTYPIVEHYVDDLVTVTEEQILQAFWLLLTRAKIVAEPSGAVTTAYALNAPALRGQRVIALISGGNVDPDIMRQLPTS